MKAFQMILFDAVAAKTFGDADFAVHATATSGLAVSVSAAGDCTISGDTLHLTGPGSCSLTASQPGDANWLAATNVAQTFTIGPPQTSPPPTTTPTAHCRVPKVVGKTLAAAKSALKRAHCATGKVSYAYSSKTKKGHVSAQSRRPGRVLPKGTKVSLIVSRGHRK
jgi:hypothetical protein